MQESVEQEKDLPAQTVTVPVRFGDQVITSLLFNHDANPVHHKPDHAVQWMLGLFSSAAAGEANARVSAEERTYSAGAALLRQQDVVVMPGIILSAICFERFVESDEHTVWMTNTFTYPLLVPTKDEVRVRLRASETRETLPAHPSLGPARRLVIEAHGPGLNQEPVRLLKLEALVFPPKADVNEIYNLLVAKEFKNLSELAGKRTDLPGLSHPAAISGEDGRRFARIVGLSRQITPSAWQAKIPRVLTEVTDHLRNNPTYQSEVTSYYADREDEAERLRAIERYVQKEVKYRHLASSDVPKRVEELAALPQLLYARQHAVFDPRVFVPGGPATVPGTPIRLDLNLYDFRLRRGIHRFFTGGRLQHEDRQVFMGEAMVTGQPLVTKELANFLTEINHSFNTLRLFDYR